VHTSNDGTKPVCIEYTTTYDDYTLSLHDALPIWPQQQLPRRQDHGSREPPECRPDHRGPERGRGLCAEAACLERQTVCCRLLLRSEEHTSELQSRENLVCRPLLEKKNLTAADHSL